MESRAGPWEAERIVLPVMSIRDYVLFFCVCFHSCSLVNCVSTTCHALLRC